MSGKPPSLRKFFPGRPFDPPLAGIMAIVENALIERFLKRETPDFGLAFTSFGVDQLYIRALGLRQLNPMLPTIMEYPL